MALLENILTCHLRHDCAILTDAEAKWCPLEISPSTRRVAVAIREVILLYRRCRHKIVELRRYDPGGGRNHGGRTYTEVPRHQQRRCTSLLVLRLMHKLGNPPELGWISSQLDFPNFTFSSELLL